jgi:hypothetical protein
VLHAPAAASNEGLESALQRWLSRRYANAYVAVLSVADRQAEAVVTVVPAARLPDEEAQAETLGLAEALRDEVLSGFPQVVDFRPGSQFVILGPERLKVEGAGEELSRVVGEVAQDVIREVTREGLSVQYLAAVGYAGPQVALEVQARGVGLGEDGRTRAREQLEREIRETVMGERYAWISYIPEQSLIEVWDAARPANVPIPMEMAMAQRGIRRPPPPPPPPPPAEKPAPEPEPEPEPEVARPPPPAVEPAAEPAPEPEDSIPLDAWTDPTGLGEDVAPPDEPDDAARAEAGGTTEETPDEAPAPAAEPEPEPEPKPMGGLLVRSPEPLPSDDHEVLEDRIIPAEETKPLGPGRGGESLDPAWTPESLRRPSRVGERRPSRGATLEELVPPSRRALWKAPREETKRGALAGPEAPGSRRSPRHRPWTCRLRTARSPRGPTRRRPSVEGPAWLPASCSSASTPIAPRSSRRRTSA